MSTERKIYVVTMRLPSVYWDPLAIFIGDMYHHCNEAITNHLILTGEKLANDITKMEVVMAFPLTSSEREKLQNFVDSELPGFVDIMTLREHYESLGISLEQLSAFAAKHAKEEPTDEDWDELFGQAHA